MSVVKAQQTYREGHCDCPLPAVNRHNQVRVEGDVYFPAFDDGHGNNLAGILHKIIYYA